MQALSPQDVPAHCREIDRCNQRGGRMLSIVDLLEAGTVTPAMAGYLMAAIGKGCSFMVGALPGGAGKTTVMGALLNLVPADVHLVPADSGRTVREGLKDRNTKRCYICHEIGSGPYYAYLWGKDLHDLFSLPAAGHMVATNLHADTIDQAREQICGDNGVPLERFDHFGLMLFLHVGPGRRGYQRRVAAVYEPAANGSPRMIFGPDRRGEIENVEASTMVTDAEKGIAVRRINALCAAGARTIQEVRRCVVGV